jgi:hypothetical protein
MSNLRPLAYAVAYTTFFFGLASMGLRAYCRVRFLKTWVWDDLWALAILIFSVGQQVILHMFLYWGCGLYVQPALTLCKRKLTAQAHGHAVTSSAIQYWFGTGRLEPREPQLIKNSGSSLRKLYITQCIGSSRCRFSRSTFDSHLTRHFED